MASLESVGGLPGGSVLRDFLNVAHNDDGSLIGGGGGGGVTVGIIASRPTASGHSGSLYFATDDTTDSSSGALYLSDGSSWHLIPRTMHGLVNAFVVEDYGAIGDGVTDDSGVFRAVIGLLDANRAGTILCKNSKYFWATNVTSTNDGTTIIGQAEPGVAGGTIAKGCTQIIVNDGITGLTLGSASVTSTRGFHLENLEFLEKTPSGSASTVLVKVLRTENCDFVNCSFGNCVLGKNFILDGTGGNGQYCNFDRCRFGEASVSCQVIACNGATFDSCLFQGWSSSLAAGSIGLQQISGDSLKVTGGTRFQGFDILVDLQANSEHTLDDSTRYEIWVTEAVHVGSSVSRSYIGGSGANSSNGSVGSGVVIDTGATDITVNADIQNVSSIAARISDSGTRTRYGTRTSMLYHPRGVGTITKGSAFDDADFDSPKDGLIGVRTDQVGIDIRTSGTWHALTGGGGSASLTSSSAFPAGDVSLSTTSFFDICSLSLTAGTWLVIGKATLLAGTTAARAWTLKLWDGTTVSDASVHQVVGTAAPASEFICVEALLAPSTTTTYKISASTTVTGDTVKQNAVASGPGTSLIAIKIA